MRTNSLLHLIVSVATSLGINAIPVGIVLAWGQSMETAMVLYFMETLVSIILAVLLIVLRAPAEDPGYAAIASTRTTSTVNGHTTYRSQPGNRRSLIDGFLIFSFGFGVVPGIFLAFWIFAIAHVEVSQSAIASGLSGIFAFQAFNFLTELVLFRTMSPEAANSVINQSMGRVALIYFSVFAGMFLALLVAAKWFIIPFAILKTLFDLSFLFRKNRAISLQPA